MNYVPVVQGSAEWLQERSGRITASRIADVLATLKRGGESAAREAYRMELAVERLTGRATEHFVSRDMEWGTENEPLARGAYETETGESVDVTGFYLHPRMEFSGASPDGLVGADGLVEIKCPKTTTHLRWMLNGIVPLEHEPQILWQLACTGRQWCDFVSFDPRLPAHLQLFIRRMQRDNDRILEIELAVEHFHAEVEELLGRLPHRAIVDSPAPAVDPDLELTDEDFYRAFPSYNPQPKETL